jgi:hypothetical protein
LFFGSMRTTILALLDSIPCPLQLRLSARRRPRCQRGPRRRFSPNFSGAAAR